MPSVGIWQGSLEYLWQRKGLRFLQSASPIACGVFMHFTQLNCCAILMTKVSISRAGFYWGESVICDAWLLLLGLIQSEWMVCITCTGDLYWYTQHGWFVLHVLMTCMDTIRMDGLYYMYIYIDYTIVCITYMNIYNGWWGERGWWLLRCSLYFGHVTNISSLKFSILFVPATGCVICKK